MNTIENKQQVNKPQAGKNLPPTGKTPWPAFSGGPLRSRMAANLSMRHCEERSNLCTCKSLRQMYSLRKHLPAQLPLGCYFLLDQKVTKKSSQPKGFFAARAFSLQIR